MFRPMRDDATPGLRERVQQRYHSGQLTHRDGCVTFPLSYAVPRRTFAAVEDGPRS